MKLIIGLGNPGDEYQDTRHNIGFMVVEKLAKEIGTEALVWQKHEKFQALIARAGDTILVKPQTFMNNSGTSVQLLMNFYKLKPSDVWVIHDDMDLPIGKIRIREKGSSAGHKGVDSIIASLHTDVFVRFRMGIGRGKLFGKGDRTEKEFLEKSDTTGAHKSHHQSVISFVLSRFHMSEAGSLKHLIKKGEQAVRIALTDGIDKAMGRFN